MLNILLDQLKYHNLKCWFYYGNDACLSMWLGKSGSGMSIYYPKFELDSFYEVGMRRALFLPSPSTTVLPTTHIFTKQADGFSSRFKEASFQFWIMCLWALWKLPLLPIFKISIKKKKDKQIRIKKPPVWIYWKRQTIKLAVLW